MSFYFAWVGGDPVPTFDLVTTGDIWGGSVEIVCNLWAGILETTADALPGSYWRYRVSTLTNMRDVSGLVIGRTYKATIGEVVADFVYDGNYSGTLSNPRDKNGVGIVFQSGGVVDPTEGLSIKLQTDIGINDIVLSDTSKLTSGTLYSISGSGISAGTTGTFLGSNTITANNGNSQTLKNVTLTFSTDTGANYIKNLGNTTGLVVGDVYQVFGRGLPGTVLGTFESDGSLFLSEFATISTKAAYIRIHHGIIYPDGGAFDEAVHARNDETVIGIDIKHSEGNFALATIALQNPHIGYLAPGRNIWCWLSWREIDGISPSATVPLFHGRLVAIPDNIQDEKVSLQFIAKPGEYEDLQAILASTLRVAPYWDPIWYDNGVDDKDTILEARTAMWHIDRTTLAVSISDIIDGEDGAIVIGEGDHLYSDMQYKIDTPPLSSVYMTGTVTWTQVANGTVDFTDTVRQLFSDGGSVYGNPNISAYQGEGLVSSWPKPLANIGGGWQVNEATAIIENTTMFGTTDITAKYTTQFTAGQDFNDQSVDDWGNTTGSAATDATGSYTETHALFRLSVYKIAFLANYGASRDWTETVSFFLEADVQQVASDSRASTESYSLSSDLVGKRIDPGGLIPLRDLRDNTYFKSSRGQDSFKFLLQYARAKLVYRARCVDITFTTTWNKAVNAGISCRMNAVVHDSRFPGGIATGKIIEYNIIANPNDGMKVIVKIGCTVGNGGSNTAVAGTGSYAEDGYVDDGFQNEIGGTVDIGDGSLVYESFDDFEVVDDGVDFFNMTPKNVIIRSELVGGITAQKTAIAATIGLPSGTSTLSTNSVDKQPLDPSTALTNCYPYVLIELVPVTGGAFLSEFYVDVSKLAIAKTIDLGAM